MGLAVLAVGAAGAYSYITYVPPFHPPPVSALQHNGYHFASGAVLRLDQSLPPVERWGRLTAPERRACIERAEPQMAEIRRALGMEWRVPLNLSGSGDPNEAYDPFVRIRDRLQALSVAVESERGVADSARIGVDLLVMAARLSQGGGVYGRGAARLYLQSGMDRMESLHGRMDLHEVREGLQRLRAGCEWQSLSRTLQWERSIVLMRLEESLKAYQPRALPSAYEWFDPDLYPFMIERVRAALRPRRSIFSEVSGYYQQVAAEADRPPQQRTTPQLSLEARLLVADTSHATVLHPDEDWVLTRMALLQVALAVRRHHLETGRHPETLAEVSRNWLPSIPRDHWNRPIAYRWKEGRPMIYSFGRDGIDGGGDRTVRGTRRASDDMVFAH